MLYIVTAYCIVARVSLVQRCFEPCPGNEAMDGSVTEMLTDGPLLLLLLLAEYALLGSLSSGGGAERDAARAVWQRR